MKAAINNTLLRNLPAGPVDIYDTKLNGFVLRIGKTGRAVYRVNYARGKVYTLGPITHLKPAEAREQATRILGEAVKGNDPNASKRRERAATLRQYLKDIYRPWLIQHRKDGKGTADRLDACFDSELGGKKLHEITAWQLEKWKSGRLKEGRAPSTIQRDLGPLKTAMNRAVEWGYLDQNPIAKVKPPQVKDDNSEPRFLSSDENLRLRKALDDRQELHRQERDSANRWREDRGYPTRPDLRKVAFTDHLKPIVLLALNTGMRRGEIFNLTWRDVDMEGASLVVRGGGAKSGRTRHIPLNAEALDTLKLWREGTGSNFRVFPGEGGGRLNNIKKSWAAVVKAAGIHDLRFHDLRHTFASWLVMRGVDLNTVRDLLGHSDLKQTLRYAHLEPEHKAQAVAVLEVPA